MIVAIDLGSNTFRAALCEQEKNSINVLESFEVVVGSARGLAQSGKISQSAINAIKEALKKTKTKFNSKTKTYIALATQAFRVAQNTDEIFASLRQDFKVDFKVINPISEAKLSFLGITNAISKLKINQQNIGFIDLGGASTEIGNKVNFKSFDIGIISFFERFKSLELLKENASHYTSDMREFLKQLSPKTLALTSGIPTTVAALRLGMSWQNYDGKKINGYKLAPDDFSSFLDEVLAMPDDKASYLLGENRKWLVVAGLILLDSILKHSSCELVVIDDGLREGIAVAYFTNELKNILKEKL